jgi:hypothetical protein
VLRGVNEEIQGCKLDVLALTKIKSEIYRWHKGRKIAKIELNDATVIPNLVVGEINSITGLPPF